MQTPENECQITDILTELTLSDKKSTIRVLHVDDDLFLLETSKMILSDENNFEIDDATSVFEALKKMECQNYDAVISDFEMPVKNGLDFLKILREQQNDIPFILFTGKGREEVVVKALNLGADRYINKNGSPETVYCELADAINKSVERKKSKQMLIKSEIKYRTLVEKSTQGILIAQTSPLRIVFANSALQNVLGFSVEDLKSLSPIGVARLICDDDKEVFFRRLEGLLHGEQPKSNLEFRAVRKDGSIVWLEAFPNRIEYMGEPAVQGMFLDITQRKKAQENLLESEERYRVLANSLPDIVFEADANGTIVYVNDKAFEIAGISSKNLEKGLNILEFIVPEDRDRAMKNIQKLLTTGSYVSAEYTFLKKDGTTAPIIVTATPRFSKNKITGLRGLAIDITERKKAEESLKESEEKFRTLAEESPNMIFINVAGRVLYANKKCEDNMGIRRAELYSPNFNFLSLISPEDSELLKSSFAKHMNGQAVPPYEYALVTRFGTRINAIITTKLIDYNGEKAILGIVTDITERKRTEELLKKNEKQLKAIILNAPIGIATSDHAQFFLSANEAFCKILGYSETELKKLTFKEITHPDEVDESISCMEDLKSGRISFFSREKRYIRKDGTTIIGKVTVSAIRENESKPILFVAELEDITERKKLESDQKQKYDLLERVGESIGAGLAIIGKDYRIFWANSPLRNIIGNSNKQCFQTFNKLDTICPDCGVKKVFEQNVSFDSHEYETVNSIGEKIWIELRVTPLKDKNGVTVAALELAIPITERKKIDEEMNQALSQLSLVNEKLGVVGSLTRHDVRNKLSAVNGYAYLLKKKHKDQPDIVGGLSKIEQAVADSEKIFEFAKMYEQLGVEKLTYVDVGAVVDEAVALFSGLTIKVVNGCHGVSVLADTFLRQMFYNFIDNTKKYGVKATAIKVYCENEKWGGLRLLYEDDGVGISAENKSKLFKEGFSTGGSTGFGLFFIKKMMSVYDWTITEEGDQGKGSKFVISIPPVNPNGKENYRFSK